MEVEEEPMEETITEQQVFQSRDKLRIVTANINGYPSKKSNKHKLKFVN